METRDVLEKMIENLGKALQKLLSIDIDSNREFFIDELEKLEDSNSDTTTKLTSFWNSLDSSDAEKRILSNDVVLTMYKSALAYRYQGDSEKSEHYERIARGLENKPKTVSLQDYIVLDRIDALKRKLESLR